MAEPKFKNRNRIDKDSKSFLRFRKEDLEKKLEDIKNTVNGRELNFFEFMEEKFGAVTDRNLELLIEELLECLIHYKAVDGFGGDWNKVSDLQQEFYECFLYCTMQGAAWVKDFDTMLQIACFDVAHTFADIVNMAKDPNTISTKTHEVLLNNEFRCDDFGIVEDGFFGMCNECYQLITGKKIIHTYTLEEQNKMEAVLQEELNEFVDSYMESQTELAQERGFQNLEEMEAYDEAQDLKEAREAGFDNVQDYYNQLSEESMTEADYKYQEDMQAWQEELFQKQQNWLHGLLNPQKFVERYLRYRELYFQVEFQKLPTDIENMVDAYLYEQGISAFSLGEDYGMLSYRLERMQNTLRNEIRKARREDDKK